MNRMLTIGERLKQKRSDMGLTVAQVSDSIKIRRKYIEALESGDFDMFSSPIYARGFLKNYAEFLGIDTDKALALYRREREERLVAGLDDAKDPFEEPKFVLTPGAIISGLVITVLISLFGYLYYQYQQFAAPPFLEILSPQDGYETTEDVITIEGSTEAGSQLTINDQEVKTDDVGKFKVTVSLRSGSNQIKVASENGIGKKSEEFVNIFMQTDAVVADNTANGESETTVPETVETGVYDGVEMEITIGPNSAWLLVETDGEVAFTGVLVADTVKTFKGASKVYIKTGNAGSTQIKINGEIQDPLGEEGDVESREFTNTAAVEEEITETDPQE